MLKRSVNEDKQNNVILTLGGQGQTFVAFNQKDGKVSWKSQNLDMSPASPIILDEDGNLALATVSPTGLKVISKVSVMKNLAWTVPTLVGTKLYLRDRRTITALDLS